MPLYVPLAVLAVGVVVLAGVILAWMSVGRTKHRLLTVPEGWVAAPGIVIDQVIEVTGGGTAGIATQPSRRIGSRLERSVIEFAAPSGTSVRFMTDAAGGYMPRPGAAVTVYFDPAGPDRAMLAPESMPRANTVTLGTARVVITVIGVAVAVAAFAVSALLLAMR